jgi:hypothetical protein
MAASVPAGDPDDTRAEAVDAIAEAGYFFPYRAGGRPLFIQEEGAT